MKGTARSTLLRLSLSSNLFSFSLLSSSKSYPLPKLPTPTRVFLGFRPLCTTPITTTTTTTIEKDQELYSMKQNILLEKLRMKKLKGSAKTPQTKTPPLPITVEKERENGLKKLQEGSEPTNVVSGFEELGLSEEVIRAVMEMGIFVPTEIQCIGIPALLDGKNVVLGSDTDSHSAALAYILPILQLLREDEASAGMLMKLKHPRAVVLCPTKELSEQVFHVAESIGHHAQFRTTMVSDGCLQPPEDSSNIPIDMVIGTPRSVLQHIEEGNMVYDEIKYLVLDGADTLLDSGFGPDISKFLGPLKDRRLKSGGQGFQIVLLISKISKMLRELQLCSLVEHLEHNNAGKVAGLLLEMDQTEAFHLIESPNALKKEMAEAMMSLA